MSKKQTKYTPTVEEFYPQLVHRIGFWSAAMITGVGLFYFIGLVYLISTGNFTTRLPEWGLVVVGFGTFVVAQIMLVLVVSIHIEAPFDKKILSHLGLVFTVLFDAMVSINRFVQLTVVRHSEIKGQMEGLERFLPYSSQSVMFALEILGWGIFSGIALLFIAPLFNFGKLDSGIRWSFITYGILSVTGAIGYVFASKLLIVGFLAWGLVLYFATAMLAIRFRRNLRSSKVNPIV